MPVTTDATTIVLAKKMEADRSCKLLLKFSNEFRKVTIFREGLFVFSWRLVLIRWYGRS